jgi:dihydroorotate dehydrogenase (NAD+) catalytic subunit
MNNAKKLEVQIKDMSMRNPVMTASGTFGYGYDYEDFLSLENLGAIVVKATTLNKREGNPYPRMAETPSGMLNAVGLQNNGVEYFCNKIYPKLKDKKTNVIVNVSGSTIEEYVEVAKYINTLPNIPAIELNISCPNVKEGGMAFGTDPSMTQRVVSQVRKAYNKTLIVKLSPNVTNIVEIAQAAENAGADSLSLINTLLGMAVDSEKKTALLSTITGGLSGPAIKPVALRCVWQVAKQTKLPIIGIGGIMNTQDAIEFILVGATAVQVGTANFIHPSISEEIAKGIAEYVDRHNLNHITDIRGII